MTEDTLNGADESKGQNGNKSSKPSMFESLKTRGLEHIRKVLAQWTNDPEFIILAYPDEHHISVCKTRRAAFENNAALKWHYLDYAISTPHNIARDLGIRCQKKTADIVASIVLTGIIAKKHGHFVAYPRSSNGYDDVNGLTFNRVKTAIEKLEEVGAIYNFVVGPGTSNKIMSFYCVHEDLVQRHSPILDANKVSYLERTITPLTVKLREQKKKDRIGDEDLQDDKLYQCRGKPFELKRKKFESLRKEVIAQNKFAQEHTLRLNIPDSDVIWEDNHAITFNTSKGRMKTIFFNNTAQWRPFLRRTKKEKELWGGRWYGGFWQQLSGDDRSLITINGKPVGKEIDFKHLHATLCFDLARLDDDDDPYELPDIGYDIFHSAQEQRKACKGCFFVLINARDHLSSIRATAKQLREDIPDISGRHPSLNSYDIATLVVDAVKAHNKDVEQFLSSDVGVQLQYIDSQIMTATQKRCRQLGILALGVHDSILVAKKHHEKAYEIFHEEYEVMRAQIRQHRLQGLVI